MHNPSSLLLADLQQSVIGAAIDYPSASTGYDPFGHARREPATVTRFGGQPRDASTGRYLLGNGYRAYSTVLRRFLSPDSFSPFGSGGINGYVYCAADPINSTDPSGHIKFEDIGLVKFFTKFELGPDFYKLTDDLQTAKLGDLIYKRGENKYMEAMYTTHKGRPSAAELEAFNNNFEDMAEKLATYDRYRKISKLINYAPGIPATLTLSNIAMGVGKHPELGKRALASAFGLQNYSSLSNADHLRMRQILQDRAERIAIKYPADTSWIENSRAQNEILRRQ